MSQRERDLAIRWERAKLGALEYGYPSAAGDYLLREPGDDVPIAVVVCTGDELGADRRDFFMSAPEDIRYLLETVAALREELGR